MTKRLGLLLFAGLLLTGCEGATGSGGLNSQDATERGLSRIAAAIVTAAFIRGFMND